jgi:O-6-methylguanine DNA methyltransferase
MRMPSVHVASVDAPWGATLVAAWDRGVVACESTVPFEPFVERLQRRLRADVVQTRHAVLDRAVAQLEEFLADRRRAFDLPIDLSDRPAWDQAVLRAVGDVPWGTVASYAQIARALDRPGAARATGGAIARSPIGIIVPCHRIITANGTLGGYGVDGFGSRIDHLRLKRELLLREGIDIPLPAP